MKYWFTCTCIVEFKPTVIRFLQRLEAEKLIERQKDNHKTIITITALGWADSEVKSVVTSEVKVDSEVDRQTYPQANLSPFIDKIINNKASVGGARTREEVVANNLELDFEKDDFDEVVAFFNEQMKGKRIPQVAVKTPERRKAYTRLMAETQVDIDSVKQAIERRRTERLDSRLRLDDGATALPARLGELLQEQASNTDTV